MRSIGLRSLSASLVRGGLAGSLWRAAVLMVLAPAGAAYGQTTFTVNSVADLVDADTVGDNDCDADLGTAGLQCTLRAAVLQANALPGADTILFDPSTNGIAFTLTRPCDPIGCYFDSGTDGDLNVFEDLVITGNGPANTVIQGGPSLAMAVDRVFSASASLTISGVTLKFGRPTDGRGGAIAANAPLTIIDSVITGNEAFNSNGFGNGGGIDSSGDLILDRVTVSSNRASSGGGVFWHTPNGLLSIRGSTFDNNVATGGGGEGGGLNSSLFGPDAPVIVVSNTTFSGNTATEGCAVYHENAPLRLHSVTVVDNCAAGSAAAALVAAYGDGNSNDGGEVRLKNSVVASPPGTDNCRVETLHGTPPGFFSEGHNLASDATCGLIQAGDVQGASPLLGPLGEQRRPDPDPPSAVRQPGDRYGFAGGLPARRISAAWAGPRTATATEAPCATRARSRSRPHLRRRHPRRHRSKGWPGMTTTATSPSALARADFRLSRFACSRPSPRAACSPPRTGAISSWALSPAATTFI